MQYKSNKLYKISIQIDSTTKQNYITMNFNHKNKKGKAVLKQEFCILIMIKRYKNSIATLTKHSYNQTTKEKNRN